VKGIHAFDYFYDPEQPVCHLDVSASVCIEFAEDLKLPKDFLAIYKGSRVYATYRGTLHGPKLEPQMEDPTVPVTARLAAASGSRYCGTGAPYKLVVEEIQEFKKVPRGVPWDGLSSHLPEVVQQPHPKSLALPGYPEIARTLEIEGSVLVEVRVEGGSVKATRVQFGDPLLVEEVTANLVTWIFDPNVDSTFVVEYIFRLERRSPNDGTNPRYEMQLPTLVQVIGTHRR
jgi:hypothetical protein